MLRGILFRSRPPLLGEEGDYVSSFLRVGHAYLTKQPANLQLRQMMSLSIIKVEKIVPFCAQSVDMFIETLASDIRYGVRQLRKSPAFTVTAIVTLAIGI